MVLGIEESQIFTVKNTARLMESYQGLLACDRSSASLKKKSKCVCVCGPINFLNRTFAIDSPFKHSWQDFSSSL